MSSPTSDDRKPSEPEISVESTSADIHEWETIRTDRCGQQHFVFLPNHPADRDREAFVIAENEAVVELVDHR